MYKEADDAIAKFPSYRAYLKDKERKAAEKNENFDRKQCLTI